eukprot:6927042-Ditylum_brightwellii.AAC.1
MYGIADTGANQHCGNLDTPGVKQQAAIGQKVYIPNGTTMTATHTCHLPIPHFSPAVTKKSLP